METPCLCPFEGHKYGRQTHKLLKWYLFWDKECLDRMFLTHRRAVAAASWMPRHAEAQKFKRPLLQNEEPFRTKTLFK